LRQKKGARMGHPEFVIEVGKDKKRAGHPAEDPLIAIGLR